MRTFLITIGIIVAIPAWFVHIQAPQWFLAGYPPFMEAFVRFLLDHDLIEPGLTVIPQLRDYALFAGITGLALIIIPFFFRR